MAEEAKCNEDGRWWAEFAYVVERVAEEDAARSEEGEAMTASLPFVYPGGGARAAQGKRK